MRASPSGASSNVYTASAMVRVRPSMFPAITMVAPNSPSARANASTVAAAIPGNASGTVTRHQVRAGGTPSVSETCS